MSEKKTYFVGVREVHVALHKVEAESAEEARRIVEIGRTNFVDLEYSHTLSPDLWTVEETEEYEGTEEI